MKDTFEEYSHRAEDTGRFAGGGLKLEMITGGECGVFSSMILECLLNSQDEMSDIL